MSSEGKGKKRMYIVTRKDDGTTRLVEAHSPQAALKHVTASTHSVDKAGPYEVMKAMQMGVRPETARDDVETADLDL